MRSLLCTECTFPSLRRAVSTSLFRKACKPSCKGSTQLRMTWPSGRSSIRTNNRAGLRDYTLNRQPCRCTGEDAAQYAMIWAHPPTASWKRPGWQRSQAVLECVSESLRHHTTLPAVQQCNSLFLARSLPSPCVHAAIRGAKLGLTPNRRIGLFRMASTRKYHCQSSHISLHSRKR